MSLGSHSNIPLPDFPGYTDPHADKLDDFLSEAAMEAEALGDDYLATMLEIHLASVRVEYGEKPVVT